ncbi:hypothetical protein [Desulfovulcanus sp.]
MITLEGIVLPDDMVLEGPEANTYVAQSVKRSLSGRLLICQKLLVKGGILNLVSTPEFGWLKRETLDAIRELANQIDANFTLKYHGDIYTVMFRHYDAPVLHVDPLLITIPSQDTQYYYGTIKLMEV